MDFGVHVGSWSQLPEGSEGQLYSMILTSMRENHRIAKFQNGVTMFLRRNLKEEVILL